MYAKTALAKLEAFDSLLHLGFCVIAACGNWLPKSLPGVRKHGIRKKIPACVIAGIYKIIITVKEMTMTET